MTLSKFNDNELPNISDGLFANSLAFGSGIAWLLFNGLSLLLPNPFRLVDNLISLSRGFFLHVQSPFVFFSCLKMYLVNFKKVRVCVFTSF
jgi:hypothetical protein